MKEKEVIAIDLGGTHLRFSVLKDNNIIQYIKDKTPKTKNKILELIEKRITELINVNTKGIGVACAGMIDNGLIRASPNIPLKGFNIKRFMKKFHKKVEVENDANCAALGELYYGVKKKNFFVLTLGTGIGGGIIIDGKLYIGRGMAGEFGKIIIENGKTFEHYASSEGIKLLIKKYYQKNANYELIKKISNEKNPKSERIKNEIANYIGMGTASLISVFDPEVIVLTGGMSVLGDPFIKKIKKATMKYNFIPRKYTIVWSKLNHPEILGASTLIK